MTNGREWVAGADGFSGGWMAVLWQPETGAVRRRVVDEIGDLLEADEGPAVVGVDMVIGLPDAAVPGGRACDREARALLGHPRGSSVFSPPAYAVLRASDFEEAQRLNRASGPEAPGLTIQTFHLLPKLRELAAVMTPERQECVREVHPELAFYAMNGSTAVEASKHDDAGIEARTDLLAANGFPDVETAVDDWTSGRLGADDVLDAHAVCWTARRIHEGTAKRLPDAGEGAVPTNARGLRMEIWR